MTDLTQELKDHIAELSSVSIAAVEKFKEEYTVEAAEKEINKELTKAKAQIIRKLLGFDKDHWGRSDYKLDHCNGRAGNSTAGQHIVSMQRKAVYDWLESVDLKSIGITKSMEASMLDEYKKVYRASIRDAIALKAKADAQAFLDKIDPTSIIGDIQKLTALLNDT